MVAASRVCAHRDVSVVGREWFRPGRGGPTGGLTAAGGADSGAAGCAGGRAAERRRAHIQLRVLCVCGAREVRGAVRPTARRVPSTGRFTEGFDNEPIRRPSGLARRGRRRGGPARTGTSCSVPSPTGSGALREGARSQSTHRPGRALPTRRAATAASGELACMLRCHFSRTAATFMTRWIAPSLRPATRGSHRPRPATRRSGMSLPASLSSASRVAA